MPHSNRFNDYSYCPYEATFQVSGAFPGLETACHFLPEC